MCLTYVLKIQKYLYNVFFKQQQYNVIYYYDWLVFEYIYCTKPNYLKVQQLPSQHEQRSVIKSRCMVYGRGPRKPNLPAVFLKNSFSWTPHNWHKSIAEKGLCVGSCIRQCVCPTATYSIDDSAAAVAPLTPKNGTMCTRNVIHGGITATFVMSFFLTSVNMSVIVYTYR